MIYEDNKGRISHAHVCRADPALIVSKSDQDNFVGQSACFSPVNLIRAFAHVSYCQSIINLTLLILLDTPIHIDTISMEKSILYFKL